MRDLIVALGVGIAIVLLYIVFEPYFVKEKYANPGEATLYFFYTDWCGYSQKAQPEWKKVMEEADGKKFGNTRLTCVAVNCETSEQKCNEYDIKGYPTVKLETEKELLDLNASMVKEKVIAFVEKTLGKKSA